MTRRYLLRLQVQSDLVSHISVTAVATADAENLGFVTSKVANLSLAMGESCVAVEIDGPVAEYEELVAMWQSHGLRVDDADGEVREL